MIKTIKKDTATYPIVFFMADSTDHISGKASLSPTVTLSKNGAAFGAAAGAVTEIGNGFYKVAGNATDSNTLGSLILHAEATGADDTDMILAVVTHNPYDVAEPGDEMLLTSAYDAAKTASQAGDAMTLTAAYDKAKDDVLTPLAVVDGVADAIKLKTDLIPASPAAIGSAMTLAADSVNASALAADAVTEIQSGLATPTNITAGTITTVTNLTNLPAITANWLTAAGIAADAVTELQAGLALEATLTAIKGAGWSTETLAAIDVLIDAIKAKTDLIPASPAAVGSAMTLTSAYDAAKTAATQASVDAIDTTPSLAVSSVEALLASTGSMALSVRYTMDETVSSTLTDDLSAATKLWFAIKESGETDANSLIFCEETAGLTIVDKTAYGTAAHGTITVSGSSGDWEVAIMIDETATTLLSEYANNNYDASVKALISGKAVHVWDGKCRITLGVIEAVS